MQDDQPTLPSFTDLRKRARFQTPAPSELFTDSSEPAVFSSDDDPSVDNYANGRRKKKRLVGSWFSQSEQILSSEAGPIPVVTGQTRKLRRDLDSGVWLASDDDSAAVDTKGEMAPATVEPTPRATSGISRIASFRNMSLEEAKAQKIIEDCIDEGKEYVDLSGLELSSLASSTVQPLSELQVIPTVIVDVPFERKEASLKLFLGRNRLTRVPAAVFDLTSLTVLSLRGNKLKELPPCIAQLRNLEDLNISQNELRWLPRELLDLILSRKNLLRPHLHPNPYCQPEMRRLLSHTRDDGALPEPSCLSGPLKNDKNPWGENGGEYSVWTPAPTTKYFNTCPGACHIARSPVQYFDGTGFSNSSFDLDQGEWLPTEDIFTEPAGPPSSGGASVSGFSSTRPADDASKGPTRCRSLLELSLQACSRATQTTTTDLRALMPDDTPDRLLTLLNRAVDVGESGSHRCARPECDGRGMVVPLTQWVDWFYLGDYLNDTSGLPPPFPPTRITFTAWDPDPIPFVSRGCSWRCVPGKAERRLPNADENLEFIVWPHIPEVPGPADSP